MITLNTNLKNRATTQYTNFNFNSMVRFAGKTLGASSSGLFDLTGDDDNGVNIDAYFAPILTDFGISNPKRLRYVYLGFEASGDLTLSVTFDEKTPRSYTVNSTKTGQQRKRVSIGRDGQGRYLGVKFSNLNGCDFSIDSADVLLVVRSNGIL